MVACRGVSHQCSITRVIPWKACARRLLALCTWPACIRAPCALASHTKLPTGLSPTAVSVGRAYHPGCAQCKHLAALQGCRRLAAYPQAFAVLPALLCLVLLRLVHQAEGPPYPLGLLCSPWTRIDKESSTDGHCNVSVVPERQRTLPRAPFTSAMAQPRLCSVRQVLGVHMGEQRLLHCACTRRLQRVGTIRQSITRMQWACAAVQRACCPPLSDML
jgi:hypothetical protein